MSESSNVSTEQCGPCNSVPGWIASGILGLVIGAGGTAVALRSYDSRIDRSGQGNPMTPAVDAGRGAQVTPGAGMPAPSGGGPPMMGMGGMGMGGMGGMGGGGFGGGGKRALTALVGKLELLSRANLKLHVELDAEQAKQIAAILAELEQTEKMTADEAQGHVEELERLLTPEQKETLSLVSLPFGGGGRGGGGRGGSAAGRPGGGGAPGGGVPPGGGAPPMMGMMGMGGGNPDENPFTQEVNQKRLRDLLGRLAPASAEAGSASP